jgi:lysophospholipase L1-like esterase
LSDTGGIILKDFSVPGARTSQLIDGLLAPAIATNPDIVTVLIGTNDIHGRVSAASFEENYRYIIESLQSKTHARIYLVSIPFTGSDQLLFPPFDYYFHLETISFNKIIYNLSQTYGVGYIDIATPTEQNFAKAGIYYAADSFHPSAAGYKLWAQIIYDHIHQ